MISSIPKYNDVRWELLIFLLIYSLVALNLTSFTRSSSLLIVCILSSIIIDTIFSYGIYKKVFFPISSLITGVGIFLLCDSPFYFVYELIILISIASKYLIKVNFNHIFNPSNLGLTVGLLFFGNILTVTAGNWGGQFYLSAIVILVGLHLAYRARRLSIVFGYLAGFILLGLVRSIILNIPLSFILSPAIGPSFSLFLFYMLTDPRVTPEDSKEQFKLSLIMSVADAILRINEQKYAPFYALFITLSIYPSLMHYNFFFKKPSS